MNIDFPSRSAWEGDSPDVKKTAAVRFRFAMRRISKHDDPTSTKQIALLVVVLSRRIVPQPAAGQPTRAHAVKALPRPAGPLFVSAASKFF